MTQDSENSSFREKLIEHLFVAELLKISWRKDCLLGVAKPEGAESTSAQEAAVAGLNLRLQSDN